MRSQRSGYLVMTPMSTVAVGRSQAASEKTYRANQISLRRFALGQPFGVNPVGLTRKIPLTWELARASHRCGERKAACGRHYGAPGAQSSARPCGDVCWACRNRTGTVEG